VSPWAIDESEAVIAIKSSSVYRVLRPDLRSPKPLEIWRDAELRQRFVTFEAREGEGTERLYLFTLAVAPSGQELVAVHRVTAVGDSWTTEAIAIHRAETSAD
jgi:hypothetical protein